MNPLTTHYIRKAALEVAAHNPAVDVYIPEAPDFGEVVAEKARQMLIECSDLATAERLVSDHEMILEQQGQIVARVAETLHAIATRSWDQEARKNEMAALGADILRVVFDRMEAVAIRELEREE